MQEQLIAKHSFAIVPIAFLLLVSICSGDARSQDVVNPSFETPSAAQASDGILIDPATTAQVGWTFSLLLQKTGSSGVQKNGSAFGGPPAPDKSQTAYINDLGTIAQKVEFKKSGDYTLSLKLAARATGTPSDTDSKHSQSILVFIDGQKNGPFTPESSSSFISVAIPFKVTQSNSSIEIEFAGDGLGTDGQLAQGELSTIFIDDISIKETAPHITGGPADLNPMSTIKLTGTNFGLEKGKFRLHFPKPSDVSFGSKSSNSKSDLTLDVDGAWSNDGTITSEAILAASPLGSVPEQTVDITVISADGQTSNSVSAKFHNDMVITGETGNLVPSALIKLTGWDFGDAGKLSAKFPLKSFVEFSHDNFTDLDLEIKSWLPYAIKAKVPSVSGALVQPVMVSFTTKDDQKSNVWPVIFIPTMETKVFPYENVQVLTCSNQGAANSCNPPIP